VPWVLRCKSDIHWGMCYSILTTTSRIYTLFKQVRVLLSASLLSAECDYLGNVQHLHISTLAAVALQLQFSVFVMNCEQD
jgi:hypothetical protein